MSGFIRLHRLTNTARKVWIAIDAICLISEEGEHARLRLSDAMVLDVDESPEQVLSAIAEAVFQEAT